MCFGLSLYSRLKHQSLNLAFVHVEARDSVVIVKSTCPCGTHCQPCNISTCRQLPNLWAPASESGHTLQEYKLIEHYFFSVFDHLFSYWSANFIDKLALMFIHEGNLNQHSWQGDFCQGSKAETNFFFTTELIIRTSGWARMQKPRLSSIATLSLSQARAAGKIYLTSSSNTRILLIAGCFLKRFGS